MDVALSKPDYLLNMTRASGLRMWELKGRALLPVVQGGMGVGVSAGRLAGTVAALGAMGTPSSVDLRRLHPGLMGPDGPPGTKPGPGAPPTPPNPRGWGGGPVLPWTGLDWPPVSRTWP